MGHLGKVFAEKEIISLLGVPGISQSNIQNYHKVSMIVCIVTYV